MLVSYTVHVNVGSGALTCPGICSKARQRLLSMSEESNVHPPDRVVSVFPKLRSAYTVPDMRRRNVAGPQQMQQRSTQGAIKTRVPENNLARTSRYSILLQCVELGALADFGCSSLHVKPPCLSLVLTW